MKKIFSKEEAMNLQRGDVFCLWKDLDWSPEYYNLIVYRQYGTRLDVFGASHKNLGLRWDEYGVSWVVSTPRNSYQRENITLEEVFDFIKKLQGDDFKISPRLKAKYKFDKWLENEAKKIRYS